MIEIKKAIENLKHLEESLDEYAGLNQEGKETFDFAIAALEKQEQDRWIPVTERLPEEDCSCRVTEDNGYSKYVIDCYWSNRKKRFEVWSDYNVCYIQLANVTAWKPSEEPYTEDEA